MSSLRSRIAALEGFPPGQGKEMTLEQAIKRRHLEGVYEPKWIREQYGIVDREAEAIEREFGLGQLDQTPTTMGHELESHGKTTGL